MSDPPALLVRRDLRVRMEHKAPRETPARKGLSAPRERLAQQAPLVRLDRLELKDPRAIPVLPEQQVLKVRPETLDLPDLRDRRAPRARPEPRGLRELQVRLALKAQRERREPPAQRVLQALQVRLGQQELRAQRSERMVFFFHSERSPPPRTPSTASPRTTRSSSTARRRAPLRFRRPQPIAACSSRTSRVPRRRTTSRSPGTRRRTLRGSAPTT